MADRAAARAIGVHCEQLLSDFTILREGNPAAMTARPWTSQTTVTGSALRRALGRTGWLAIEPQAAALPSIARNPQGKENAMPLMTGDDYRQSLLDGRRCYIDGDRISDPSTHPLLARAVTSVAATYDRFYSPDPCAFHPNYLIPKSREDLDGRMALRNPVCPRGGRVAAVPRDESPAGGALPRTARWHSRL